MSGLLIADRLFDIPGVEVIGGALDQRDFRARSTAWVRQIIIHAAGAENCVTQIEVDVDGNVVCLCDLHKVAPGHAGPSDDYSVGIKMHRAPDGSVREATLESTVKAVLRLCDLLSIPLQGEARPYAGAPIARGADAVGVFGCRDIALAGCRDNPGDEVFLRLRAAGMILHRYDARPIPGDKAFWSKIQDRMNKTYGINIGTDGVCGPQTTNTLRKYGLWNGGVFAEAPAL